MDVSSVNDRLSGYTTLLGINLRASEDARTFHLRLDLGAADTVGAPAIAVEFVGVSHLRLSDFGGGDTQLVQLRVTGVDERDCHYEVSELAHECLSFKCRSIRDIVALMR